MHKKKEEFDFSGWEILCAEDCPQQHNGFDCGVYVLAIAELLCLAAPAAELGRAPAETAAAAVRGLTPTAITEKRREWYDQLAGAVAEGAQTS